MFSAVHSDRSGRIVVAADYGAALSDGHSVRPFARAISLPPGTEVVALADREAVGLDRAGRVRPLGDGRWAVGAILPLGHLRTALPAMTNDLISLLKDSSLVSVITVVELTKQMTITAVDVRSWALPGLTCAGLYFAMSYPLARLASRLEARLFESETLELAGAPA